MHTQNYNRLDILKTLLAIVLALALIVVALALIVVASVIMSLALENKFGWKRCALGLSKFITSFIYATYVC